MPAPSPAPPGRIDPEKLFHPASVAVIGAGLPLGARVLANLRAGGFGGRIDALDDAAGLETLTQVPDLALVCTEGEAAPPVFAALARSGAHMAVVLGMVPALGELVRTSGVRALGPGSFGIAVPGIGLNASVAHLPPRPGRLALVSQSAALCRAVLDWAGPNGVGFSTIVGIGGNEDIGFSPVLDWLSRDPGTGAILLDIRRIRDARRFLSAARAAARLRPVVAIRAGGRLLDPAGAAEATFAAALHRVGVLRVDRLEDLLAAAETLTRACPARGEALAIATNAIGPAWLGADAALRDGLALAELAPATREVLRLALPDPLARHVTHPDIRARADIVYAGVESGTRLAEAAALLAGAPEVGGVLVVHAPSGPEDGVAIEALLAAAKAARVPLLVAAMGETSGTTHRSRLAGAGLPVFATPEAAVRGFLHLVQHRRTRAAAGELPPSAVLALAPDRAAVAEVFARARAAGRRALAQDEALAVLAAYGIPSVPTRHAEDAEAARAAAEDLGFPVVLKRRRSEPPHPGERGEMVLDLRDAAQVRDAARLLLREAPEGLIVQPQLGRMRELRIAVAEDPVFGPTIAFGQGGTAAEVIGDHAVDLPPLNLPLARALIGRTRIGRALGPRRDLPAADTEAIAGALVGVSQLLVDFPELAMLELNPLFAGSAGVQAAGAWIALRESGATPARLAIAPYPAELCGTFQGRREVFAIRPIRPEDAEAHAAFFTRLAPEDVRLRFFSTVRALSPEQIVRFTEVDYEREIALIAVRPGSGETVGVGRLVREGDGKRAEFAIILQPDAKGQGLGRHLLERLMDWARGQEVTEITAQVLAENAPMLALARRLGFTLHRMPGEPDVIEIRRRLDGAA
jgi:acetyltransferase